MSKESLIWKYIDRDCNDEEMKEAQVLLERDDEFKSLYLECKRLDDLLHSGMTEEMSDQFKVELMQAIISKPVIAQPVSTSLLNIIQWTAICIFVFIGFGITYIYSTKPSTHSDFISDYLSLVSQETISLTNILVISMTLLMVIDVLIKYLLKQKSAVII